MRSGVRVIVVCCLLSGSVAACSKTVDARGGARLAEEFGGPEVGLAVDLPDGWRTIDLSLSDAAEAAEDAGLDGMPPEVFEQSVEQMKKQNGAIAFKTDTVGTGFATNVNGFCMSQPWGTAAQVKAQMATAGFTDVEVREQPVAGREALRATYKMTMQGRSLDGDATTVKADGDKACTVTVTAPDGEMPPEAEQIHRTVKVF